MFAFLKNDLQKSTFWMRTRVWEECGQLTGEMQEETPPTAVICFTTMYCVDSQTVMCFSVSLPFHVSTGPLLKVDPVSCLWPLPTVTPPHYLHSGPRFQISGEFVSCSSRQGYSYSSTWEKRLPWLHDSCDITQPLNLTITLSPLSRCLDQASIY